MQKLAALVAGFIVFVSITGTATADDSLSIEAHTLYVDTGEVVELDPLTGAVGDGLELVSVDGVPRDVSVEIDGGILTISRDTDFQRFFRYTVQNSDGDTAQETIVLSVSSGPSQPPVVDAGGDFDPDAVVDEDGNFVVPDHRLRVTPEVDTPFSPLGTPLPDGFEIVDFDTGTSDDVHVEIVDGETLIITKENVAVRLINYTVQNAAGETAEGRIVLPHTSRISN